MKDTVLDKYFIRPIFWDLMISLLIDTIFVVLICQDVIKVPSEELALSMLTDISNIGFTVAGLILTMLTILITFKSNSKITKENDVRNERLFDLFFATGLYHETVKHFKNSLFSLLAISSLGYFIKFIVHDQNAMAVYVYSIFSLCILILTILKSTIQLSLIINLQKESDSKENQK